jgi:predicted DNA-binding transcriptional regulator YafY
LAEGTGTRLTEELVSALVTAIQHRKRVRLAYQRKADEVVSIHEIAPVDIRIGWTPDTSGQLYVWAWCYAEDRLEMHLLDRVVRVIHLDETFDPASILHRWPRDRWPIPDDWSVPREW